MASRVSFSGEHLGFSEIAGHHRDLESSLTLYFSTASPNYLVRFATYAAREVIDDLRKRLNEADLTSSLTALASVEAAFRIDYLAALLPAGKRPCVACLSWHLEGQGGSCLA